MQLCQKGYPVFSLRYNLKSCGLFRISSIVARIFFGGNINIHATGFQLCRIVAMEYDDEILKICLESWEKLGYNPTVEQIENG